MKKAILILLILSMGRCLAETPESQCPAGGVSEPTTPTTSSLSIPLGATLEGVLGVLRRQTESLGSYQATLKYLFIQDPELLDSRTLRTGSIHYRKSPQSQLRIQFDTFKQEDTKEEKRLEQFFFDGVWLTRIDHTLKKADLYQKAKPEKPLNVLEFLNTVFPIVGFAKTENLSKDFTISLIAENRSDPNQPIHLLLVTRPESKFAEQYKKIDFWIDGRQVLPQRIVTASTEGDIYDISFVNAVVNQPIDPAIFIPKIPEGFTQNKELLQEDNNPTEVLVPQGTP